MKLSKHFTLEELTISQTAARFGLSNKPPPAVLENLKVTAAGLDAVRDLISAPVAVSSGYRSPQVNKLVGGSQTSQHMLGQAADITAPAFGSPKKLMAAILKSGIKFDQCILEYGSWVHISFSKRSRMQTLIIDKNGKRAYR